MFVYSVRATTVKFFAIMFAGIAALVALILFIPTAEPVLPEAVVAAGSTVSYEGADTAEGRAAFLKQFGWEVDPASEQERAVTVPDEFDTVFSGYNEIQKKQGLDLERYRRKEVMRYTYAVTNYPEYDGTVLANLLVYRGRVIGGDICSEAAYGFIHGFEKPKGS